MTRENGRTPVRSALGMKWWLFASIIPLFDGLYNLDMNSLANWLLS